MSAITPLYSPFVSDSKTDTFNDSVIKLDHKFWGDISGSRKEFGYIVNYITITNIDSNEAHLENLSVLLDTDDNSINWEVLLINASYQIESPMTLNFGSLKPGQSITLSYRWIGKCINGIPGDTKFDYQFNLMPSYTVIYNKAEAWESKGSGNPV